MSSKPVYQGTYAQYMAIPYPYRDQYAPPVATPEGYAVHKVESKTVSPMPRQGEPISMIGQTYEQVTFVPKIKRVKEKYGFQVYPEGRTPTPKEKAELEQRYLAGENIFYNPEEYAILKLSAAVTSAAVVTSVPAAVGSAAFLIGGEGVKVGVTGKHLTSGEAIMAAGIGASVGIGVSAGVKALQPRVQRGLEASYRRSIESQQLWKPSRIEKLAMKVTGAQPPSLAQEIVGAGEPRGVTLSMLKKGKTIGPEESYFWDTPMPKSVQLYVRGYPKTKAWVETTLFKSVHLHGLFTTTIPTRLLLETPSKLEPKIPHIPKAPAITRATSIMPAAFRASLLLPSAILTIPKVKSVTKQTAKQVTRKNLIQKSAEITIANQIVGSAQTQRQTQKQILGLTQSQVQAQRVKQQISMVPPKVPKVTLPIIPSVFPFYLRRGGGSGTRSFDRLFGKWYPRKHKVKTWEQQLKTFEIKIPKNLAKFGKSPKTEKIIGSLFGKTPRKSRKTKRKSQKRRKNKR